MSKDLNQCNFIGRLGKDVETRHLTSGEAVANFSIAVGDDYKDKQGNKVEQTEWVSISAFGKLAEICNKYLKKGSKVYVSGKMNTRKWKDQSGQDRYSTGIKLQDMIMIDSKGSDQDELAQGGNFSDAPKQPSGSMEDFDDELPF